MVLRDSKGKFVKGHLPSLVKHTEKTKRKMSIVHKGKKVSEETKRKLREINTGKKHSKETRKKMSETQKRIGNKPLVYKGSNHPCWKGGLVSFTKRVRDSMKYQEWRQQVYLRDDFTCQKCGSRGCYLEAHHHKKSFKQLLEEVKQNLPLLDLYSAAMIYTPMWDIKWGQTHCYDCHNKTKRKKKNG